MYFINGIYTFDDNIEMYKNIKECNIYINVDNLKEKEAYNTFLYIFLKRMLEKIYLLINLLKWLKKIILKFI